MYNWCEYFSGKKLRSIYWPNYTTNLDFTGFDGKGLNNHGNEEFGDINDNRAKFIEDGLRNDNMPSMFMGQSQ